MKQEECCALLEHLQAEGLVSLPKLRATTAPGPRKVVLTTQSDPQIPVTGSAGQFEPFSLHLVQASDRELHSIFKQLIERCHCLAYRIPFGAHLNYLVESQRLPGRYLDCMRFSNPAMYDGPARCLDWMERRTTETESSLHCVQ